MTAVLRELGVRKKLAKDGKLDGQQAPVCTKGEAQAGGPKTI